MSTLLQDLRYGLRLWLRTPGLASVAVAALALGIGANTAIFTVVNAVLLERLPFRDPGRIVVLWEQSVRRPGRPNVVGPANFVRWQERARSFERMAAFADLRATLTGGGVPEEVVVQYVTRGFFDVLGVPPLVGRTFTAQESDDPDATVVVMGYALWQRRFGGDPGIVGRTIDVNGRPREVIGVMPKDVGLLLPNGSLAGKPSDLWGAYALPADARDAKGRYLSVVARLQDGGTLAQARAEMHAMASGLEAELPALDTGWSADAVPVAEELSGAYRPALLVLLGAVAFVLLIACANVANLLMARGAARQREIAVRVALGAGRGRIARQLLTESLVLGVAGGVVGLIVAEWSLSGMIALSPVDLPSLDRIGLSYPTLLFTALVSLVTAVLCGVAPAFEASRADVQDGLKEGARQAGGVRRSRVRHALVVAEVALAVVLLVGAGLMLRTLWNLRGVDPGFDAGHVLTLRASLPGSRYPTDGDRIRFFTEAVARVRALPGVTSAGAISFLPFSGLGAATGFRIAGRPEPPPGQEPTVDVRVADNGYFETMHIPLVRGRWFTEREMGEPANVVIVSQTLARQYFPGEDPIGQKLFIAMTKPNLATRIIGVVGDARATDLTGPIRAMSYWPQPQLAYGAMTFTVRTAGDPLAIAGAVTSAIQSIDRDQPVSDVKTMDQWLAHSLAITRFSSVLLAAFAALALLLAAIGVYGVMSYAVSLRTPEIGVRLALGADARSILRLVVGDGLALAAVGLTAGVLLALALARTIASLLFETGSADPATFAAAVALLGAVALAASYLPARRASRIEPVDAMRYQ